VKKVVPIVALLVLAAAIALVVMRPGSSGGDPTRPGGMVDVIGGLLPATELTAADVQGQPCWDRKTLTVPPAGTCVTRLPSAATRLTLCATGGVPDVRVDGTSYGPQRIKPARLSCPKPDPIRLYDNGSRLLVTCLGTVPCRLSLL
jgi:hypothetical protein